MATDKRQFTLRLKEDNFSKIRYIAEKNKRSISMQIEYLVEKCIDEFESNYDLIDLSEPLELDAANQEGGSNSPLRGPAAKSEADFKKAYRKEMQQKKQ